MQDCFFTDLKPDTGLQTSANTNSNRNELGRYCGICGAQLCALT